MGRLRRLGSRVFINRNFALLWWGQAISSVGDYAWDTALVLWIATFVARGRSWASLAISGVLLAREAQIIVGPVAGVFVDRLNRRLTMIATTFLTICSQFFIPAQLALIKDLVSESKQDQAIETSQEIAGLAVIIGPPNPVVTPDQSGTSAGSRLFLWVDGHGYHCKLRRSGFAFDFA